MGNYRFIEGTVTSPMGFTAAGICASIKPSNKTKRDLALIYCDTPCTAAAVYTKNLVKSSAIEVTKKHLEDGIAQAVIVNSGNANTCNANGYDIANHMCLIAAETLGVKAEDVIVASTGVIGQPLPIQPILKACRSAGIPMLTRAELLGEIMRNYKTAIAVAGTHGKTTTTSMISMILLEAQADPTISVGGILPEIGGNIRVGRSDLFLTEACEYTNSFLSFFPTVDVILNIEEDHLDFFKDLADIRHSFHRFAELLPAHGLLVMNGEIKNIDEITNGVDADLVTYKVSGEADYTASDITYDRQGCASFTLVHKGTPVGPVELHVPGIHNVSNALAALATTMELGFDFKTASEGLAMFHGTDRRFQYKGEVNGVTIIDDYAHHPSEIRATLKAAANYPHREIWCVFQPHTYTRTRAFMHEFAEALSLADHVVLADNDYFLQNVKNHHVVQLP